MKKNNKVFLILSLIAISFILLIPSYLSKANNTNPTTSNKDEVEKFTLKPLPYKYNALEPYIDKKTMQIHHTKHQQAYVDNLNKALAKYPELYKKTAEELISNTNALPLDIKQAVINNAGGVSNHEFFWTVMSPEHNQKPHGNLLNAINDTFGCFDKFKEEFSSKALSNFGSGWTWLVKDSNNKLSIMNTANQDSPISLGYTPILGIDVWEHAYYLKYQNRRAEYINNWWNIINFDQVEIYFNS